ncbi:MAG: hypothetical protein KC418_16145, partial [Anaerolineales bacterium]|nr:hypothetical protein [Anaerolineales bacterium]
MYPDFSKRVLAGHHPGTGDPHARGNPSNQTQTKVTIGDALTATSRSLARFKNGDFRVSGGGACHAEPCGFAQGSQIVFSASRSGHDELTAI